MRMCARISVRAGSVACVHLCGSGVAYSPEKKAAHCPRAVPGLRSSLKTGPASLELCVSEARPCSQLFVQLAHQQGPQGRDPPPSTQTQPDTSTAAPTQVTNLLTPSPAGYLLRGHRLRRVFCSALIWSTVSAWALVISAIDLLQMS